MKKPCLPFREYNRRQTIATGHPVHKARAQKILGREATHRELFQIWVDLCAKYFGKRYTHD